MAGVDHYLWRSWLSLLQALERMDVGAEHSPIVAGGYRTRHGGALSLKRASLSLAHESESDEVADAAVELEDTETDDDQVCALNPPRQGGNGPAP
jgi:hypothetical protein